MVQTAVSPVSYYLVVAPTCVGLGSLVETPNYNQKTSHNLKDDLFTCHRACAILLRIINQSQFTQGCPTLHPDLVRFLSSGLFQSVLDLFDGQEELSALPSQQHVLSTPFIALSSQPNVSQNYWKCAPPQHLSILFRGGSKMIRWAQSFSVCSQCLISPLS